MIRHIPGVDNSVVDALSRLQLSRFRSLAPRADPTPTTTPAEPTYTSNSASLHFRLQEQGVADSTRRTYKSGVQAFSTFCRSYGQSRHLNSPSGTLWPTSTARYPVSYATIKVFLSAIRLLHLEHHCWDPLTNSPLLHYLCQAVRRSQPSCPPQRHPIMPEHLKTIKRQLALSTLASHDKLIYWARLTFAFSRSVNSPPPHQPPQTPRFVSD